MMKLVWNWGHIFGIMCETLFECVLSVDIYVIIEIPIFFTNDLNHID